MKKNRNSKSGLFTLRALLALVLCSLAISMAMLSFAGPKAASTAGGSNDLKPVVVRSLYNGVSSALRDLPLAGPTPERDVEDHLLRVKPTHPVPPGFVDAAAQVLPAAAAAPTPNGTFEGQTSVDSAGGSATGCLCTPPDTNGAAGPNQYVQMVNSVFSVYDKSGTRLAGPTQINALWENLPGTCKDNNQGDPVVVYDQLADRWVVTQFAVPTNDYHECIAVSKGPDATGEYYIYDFPLSTTKWQDYPHFGLWPDAYYMSMHQFTPDGSAYVGASAFAFERDRMLKGQPAQMLYFDLGTLPAPFNTGFGGHLPANLDGFTLPPAGAPNYFVQVDSSADAGLGANLRLWKFHVDWNTPANSSFGLSGLPNSIVPVTDFARPDCTGAGGCVPQLGSAGQLDAIGDRLMYRLAYRNFGDHESLVLNHSVVANSTTMQIGPRWYEVRDPGGTPTIFQQSTFGPTSMTDLLYRWMGSVAMDRAGDIAIGYSTSSSASFPSIAYAGRLASDPLNTLGQGETQLFAGTGPQHNEVFIPFSPTGFGRWGDYSDMTVDPLDDCTFWYTNLYYSSTDAPAGIWHTRVGNFKFPQCTPRQIGFLRGTVTDSSNGSPLVGATVTAGGYTAITNGSGFYQFSPLSPGSYTDTASAVGYFSSSAAGVTVTNGGVTTRDFALVRNAAVPTPTPAPPKVLQTVNPPVLNDPGTTITTSSYSVSWNPAEVTAGLASYVVEESTDYVNPLFDNADGATPPGQAASLWTSGSTTDPWIVSPQYHNSIPNSYHAPGEDEGFLFGIDTSLTLKNNITVAGTVGSSRLTFYSRYFNGVDDTGNIDISTDGGSTWTSLRKLNDSPLVPPADTRVQSHEIDLSAYKGIPFKLRFRFDGGTTLGIPTTFGWWIDDINVDGGTWTQIGTTGPGATSLNISAKPNGHYYYRVRAVYTNGNLTTHSNVQDIIVNAPNPPTLVGAVSRKTHTGVDDFDIDLPLSGNAGIECRTGGPSNQYKLIFKFGAPVTSCGTASKGTASTGPTSSQCTVVLSDLATPQYYQINLNGVVAASGAAANITGPRWGLLVGDVTGNGTVTGADVSGAKAQIGAPVSQSNFRNDVTGNGVITGADVSAIKAQVGLSLP